MNAVRPSFTIGIEEEFQVIDPETRELRSHIAEIFEQGRAVLKERLKPRPRATPTPPPGEPPALPAES